MSHDSDKTASDKTGAIHYQGLRDIILESTLKELGVEIDKIKISDAANKFGFMHDSRSFLALDDRFSLRDCGHYLIYGSEYILAVVGALQDSTGLVFQRDLQKIGIPTVFEFDLPTQLANKDHIYHLVRDINNAIYEEEPGYLMDFTFEIYQTLEPEYIVRHYHPEDISDPLECFGVYKTEI